MWSMNVSGRIEKRQSWGGSGDPKWSQRLPALIALPIRGSTCVGGERIVKKKIGRPRKVGPFPWEGLGISRALYYVKKSKGEV
jgi:hypothetical protein